MVPDQRWVIRFHKSYCSSSTGLCHIVMTAGWNFFQCRGLEFCSNQRTKTFRKMHCVFWSRCLKVSGRRVHKIAVIMDLLDIFLPPRLKFSIPLQLSSLFRCVQTVAYFCDKSWPCGFSSTYSKSVFMDMENPHNSCIIVYSKIGKIKLINKLTISWNHPNWWTQKKNQTLWVS